MAKEKGINLSTLTILISQADSAGERPGEQRLPSHRDALVSGKQRSLAGIPENGARHSDHALLLVLAP